MDGSLQEDVTAIRLLRQSAGSVSDESEESGSEVLSTQSFKRYWCRAWWFARLDCGYDFEALRATVPETSVSNAYIRGFCYSESIQYGAEEFKKTVYRPHRKVEDKSKGRANTLFVAP